LFYSLSKADENKNDHLGIDFVYLNLDNMKKTAYILTLLIATGLFACGSTKDATSGNAESAAEDAVPKAKIVNDLSTYRNTAALTIKSVLIKGDLMTMNVQYSGGCEEHEFKLLGSAMIEKTMPVKRGIILYHDNKGDSCRELVDDILVFDIKDLGISKQEVVLILDGYETPLPYRL